jgi:hypothetical protein
MFFIALGANLVGCISSMQCNMEYLCTKSAFAPRPRKDTKT